MNAREYVAYDAVGLSELVQRGEVSALELADAAIERIEALNGRLNAVVETHYEAARLAARDADPARPLAGVPFLAKDMDTVVAGLRLTASCRWLSRLPAAMVDAPLAKRWRDSGLTILGRTNTPEWAEDFVTEPTFRGATANPWDLSRSPGGSSGGAAAAVAAGMVPIAHGTDSGGSIRVPASACGLVGLKPSRGVTPVGLAHDELAGGFDVNHVLSRTVRDSARMLDVTAGPDSVNRYPFARHPTPYVEALAAPLRPLKIGYAANAPGGAATTAVVGDALEAVVRLLAGAGHTLVPYAFPREADIGQPAALIWMTAIAEDIAFYEAAVGGPPDPADLEAVTRECLRVAHGASAVDYVRARRACTAATRAVVESMEPFDLLLTPTTASLPPMTGEIDGRSATADLARWSAASYGYAPFTELFNATGQPAISVPLAQSPEGLPIGMQLIAPLGADALLLTVAAHLERELPWSPRLAALAASFI